MPNPKTRRPARKPAAAKAIEPSPGNPCPFLRALVTQGLLPDGVVAPAKLARTVARVARTGEGRPALPAVAIHLIALAAPGLSPLRVWQSQSKGVPLNALRDGPLDKHGVGSRILDEQSRVVPLELDRLQGFGSLKTATDGTREHGLDAKELRRFMDDNFARAAGQRRLIDRALMDGEWPVLLKVMGKRGAAGRYLSMAELRSLVIDRQLPARMSEQL